MPTRKTSRRGRRTQRARAGRRYGSGASKAVRTAMRKRKSGKLKSGRSGKTVTSRKQAVAIGLSEARRKGARVPAKK